MQLDFSQKLSVLIITLNEAENIKELLNDLDFADEIIVVDSFSTDNTEVVARSFSKVKFISNKFENYASQRNFAIEQAKNDWILFLDADERITAALKKEIVETLRKKSECNAYLFRREFMFKNRKLRFSGLQTDAIFRLFNKNFAHYSREKLVHEKLEVEGSVATFKNKLLHYSYKDYSSYKAKAVQYGKLKAKELDLKGTGPIFGMSFVHPLYNFLYNYLIRLGFLDGKKGIIICYLNAYSVLVRYRELGRLYDAE